MTKKEEILKKWRGFGFLMGFKEGSINEWRCAKSYDNLANYLMEHEWDEKMGYLSVISMPFIHRALSTGKKRLYRFIKADEIISFFEKTTMGELFTYMSTKQYKKKEKFAAQVCMDISKSELYNSTVLLDFLYGLGNGDEKYTPIKDFFKNVIDVEAEFLALASEYFVEIKS